MPLKIARPFNNYGPGLKITDGRALPDFAEMLAGDDIVMLSDGAPTRTFCYVADAVVGYFKVLLMVALVNLIILEQSNLKSQLKN